MTGEKTSGCGISRIILCGSDTEQKKIFLDEIYISEEKKVIYGGEFSYDKISRFCCYASPSRLRRPGQSYFNVMKISAGAEIFIILRRNKSREQK